MKSIRSIYKIGRGPSGSHTMAPSFAAKHFISEFPDCDRVCVYLYGSLAKTGKGHGTVLRHLRRRSCSAEIYAREVRLP